MSDFGWPPARQPEPSPDRTTEEPAQPGSSSPERPYLPPPPERQERPERPAYRPLPPELTRPDSPDTGGGTARPLARPSGRATTATLPSRQATVTPRAVVRGPRKVKYTLARLDPWSALKVSFVYGVAGLVVVLVAVSLLYGLVDAMGVLSSVRKFLNTVASSNSGPGITAWLGFGRIFLVTLVLGAINVVLISALATMGAFIYNVSSEVVGGVEMTLVERG